MTKAENPRRIELKTFGGVVGRAAVDVQKPLIEGGYPAAAIDFNARLDAAVDKGHRDLTTVLRYLSYFAGENFVDRPLQSQIKLAERFIKSTNGRLQGPVENMYVNFLRADPAWNERRSKAYELWKRFAYAFKMFGAEIVEESDGTKRLVVPMMPYRLRSEIEIPWGSPAELVGRRLEALSNGKTIPDVLRSLNSERTNHEIQLPTRHEGILALIQPRNGRIPRPRFLVSIPTRELLTAKRHDPEVVRI